MKKIAQYCEIPGCAFKQENEMTIEELIAKIERVKELIAKIERVKELRDRIQTNHDALCNNLMIERNTVLYLAEDLISDRKELDELLKTKI